MSNEQGRAPLGCLVLHGLTSSLATVDGLVPYLRERGIPYRLPTLRGHGATPEALRGVTWRQWYEDAERALDDLLEECDRAVVVGLSMGGVVALHLTTERQAHLAGTVVVAPALRLAGTWFDRVRIGLRAAWHSDLTTDARGGYEDVARAALSTNYTRVPARTVLSLVEYGRRVERLLPRIRVPLLVIYTPRDRVVQPQTARLIYDAVSTPAADKRLLAFTQSGHEMLQDHQRDEIFETIASFIERLARPLASLGAGR